MSRPETTAPGAGAGRWCRPRVARSGKDSVDHAPGGRDDVANAVAGVLVAVTGPSRQMVLRDFHVSWSGVTIGPPQNQSNYGDMKPRWIEQLRVHGPALTDD